MDFKPLYSQVREEIVRRLADGEWPPGAMLPSEQALSHTLGVSQGTVRKALDMLTHEGVLTRRQGRGTFVAEFEDARVLFRFFRLRPDTGEHGFPRSEQIALAKRPADDADARTLALDADAPVWRLERVRFFDDGPVIAETIVLSAAQFPDMDKATPLPNNVYRLYAERYGRSVARTTEALRAVAATPQDAVRLDCGPGTPLLAIERIAFDVAGAPVERRLSRCRTDAAHYTIED